MELTMHGNGVNQTAANGHNMDDELVTHAAPGIPECRILTRFRIVEVEFPYNSKYFHGFFRGKCIIERVCPPATMDVVLSHRATFLQFGTFSVTGKVLSLRRDIYYYGYIKLQTRARCNMVVFDIKQIVQIELMALSKDLLKIHLNEFGLSDFSYKAVMAWFEDSEAHIGAVEAAKEENILKFIESHSVIERIQTGHDYYLFRPVVKYAAVFPHNIYRLCRVATQPGGPEFLDEQVRAHLYDVVIHGERTFGLGLPAEEGFISMYAKTDVVKSQLQLLFRITKYRRESGSTHLPLPRQPTNNNNNNMATTAAGPVPMEDLLLDTRGIRSYDTTKPNYTELVASNVLLQPASGFVALDFDEQVERRICTALKMVATRFYNNHEDIKAQEFLKSPAGLQMMFELNPEQQVAARNILMNPIYCITGIPGSGKTEIAAKLCKYYLNAFVMTFVGVMANSLKARLGKGNTMHSLIYQHLKLEEQAEEDRKRNYSEVAKLLKPASTVVFDEISNACVVDFANALEAVVQKKIVMAGLVNESSTGVDLTTCVPGQRKDRSVVSRCNDVVRIVFIGDLNQIPPIGIGKFGIDIAHALGTLRQDLVTNVRVHEGSRKLVELDTRLLALANNSSSSNANTGGSLLTNPEEQGFLQMFKPTIDLDAPIMLLDPKRISTLLPQILDKMFINKSSEDRLAIMAKSAFLSFEKKDVAYVSRVIKYHMKEKTDYLLMVGRKFMIIDRKFNRKRISGGIYNRGNGRAYCIPQTPDSNTVDEPAPFVDGKYMEKDKALYSDEVRNGEQYCVKAIRLVKIGAKSAAAVATVEFIPANFIEQPGFVWLVTTQCGKNIAIAEKFVPPRYIVYGSGATVNKMQGSEAEIVIGYLRPDISKNLCWNRSHLHVLLSRARTTLILFATHDDLITVARRIPPLRETQLQSKLQKVPDFIASLADVSSSTINLH